MARRSFRDTLNANDAAQRYYAAMAGKPVVTRLLNNLPPPREVVNHTAPELLEANVMKEVSRVLTVHPRVLFAMRCNSGAAWLPGKNGKEAPVWFYRIIRQPSNFNMTLPDYVGFLRDMRPFAFECKKRQWDHAGPNARLTQRELKQRAYLDMIRSRAGVADFVTSGEQVLALLDAA